MSKIDLSDLTLEQGIRSVVQVGKNQILHLFQEAPSFGKVNNELVDAVANDLNLPSRDVLAAMATVASFIENENGEKLASDLQTDPYNIEASTANSFVEVLRSLQDANPDCSREYKANLAAEELDSIYQPTIIQGKWNVILTSSPSFPDIAPVPFIKVSLKIGHDYDSATSIQFFSRTEPFERFVEQMNEALIALKKAGGKS